MDIDRITHCLERLERDAAVANRLKIAELKIRLGREAGREISALEQEQAEIDAERAGKYVEPTPPQWDAPQWDA